MQLRVATCRCFQHSWLAHLRVVTAAGVNVVAEVVVTDGAVEAGVVGAHVLEVVRPECRQVAAVVIIVQVHQRN